MGSSYGNYSVLVIQVVYRYDIKRALPVAIHVLHIGTRYRALTQVAPQEDAEEAGRRIHMCRPIAILIRSNTKRQHPVVALPDRAYSTAIYVAPCPPEHHTCREAGDEGRPLMFSWGKGAEKRNICTYKGASISAFFFGRLPLQARILRTFDVIRTSTA